MSAEFTILGSSSGLPQADRACSSYLLQTGGSLSLIDCGGGACRSFLQQGFNPNSLDRIFISHTHSDHCCELPLVIQMLHVMRLERRLDIFVPSEYIRPFFAQLNAMYLFPQHIEPELNIQGYADGFEYAGDGFRLRATANMHLEKSRLLVEQYDVPNQLQCHSYRIETENCSLVYSADLGSLDDISDQLHDLDYALIESTHIDLDLLFELAKERSVGRIILTHLGLPEEVAALREKMAASGATNVELAEDGLKLKL